jgi:hypothetical protein
MKRIVVGLVGAGLLALAGGSGTPATAGELPWCVEKANGGLLDCSYYTHQQCLETSRGDGPCIRNGAFDWKYYLRGEVAPLDLVPGSRRHHGHRWW